MAAQAGSQETISVERWYSEIPLLAFVLIASLGIWVLLIVSIIGIIYGLLLMVFFFLMHLAFIAHIRGNGVALGPQQMPDLYERVKELSMRTGLKQMPQTYLIQAGGTLNALATKFLRSRMVILYTDLLEACGEDAAARDMIIGHELGHIAAGHLSWSWFLVPGMAIPFLGSAYSRAREYTCDRYGAALTHDKSGTLHGLAILAAGGTYAKKVNLQSLVEQKRDMNTGWMTLGKWLMSHPPLCDRLAALEPSLARQVPSMSRGPVRALLILALAIALPVIAISVIGYVYWPKIRASYDQARNQAIQSPPVSVLSYAAIETGKKQVDADFKTMADVIDEHRHTNDSLPKNREELSAIWKKLRPGTKEPADPFDGYLYGYSEEAGEYYLWSSGPDGRNDTDDDIVFHGGIVEKKGN